MISGIKACLKVLVAKLGQDSLRNSEHETADGDGCVDVSRVVWMQVEVRRKTRRRVSRSGGGIMRNVATSQCAIQ